MVPFLLLVALALLPGIAHSVTIYRFGGEDLPRPPEVGQPGVVFRQLPWTRLGEAGSRVRIRADQAIAPFQHTRFTPLPLLDFNPSRKAAPLFDTHEEGCRRDVFFEIAGYLCGARSSCRGVYGLQGTLNIWLDDRVVVDRVRIVSGDCLGLGLLRDFGLFLSPDPVDTLQPQTPFTVEVRGNRKSVLDVTGLPEYQRSAAIQLAVAEDEHPVKIREIEVFAHGPASESVYTSAVIDFGRPAAWGGLRWSLRGKAGSRALLATRAGQAGDDILRYWKYTGIGDQRVVVSRDEYEAVRSTLRAGTTYNYDSWTVWSAQADLADPSARPPLPASPLRAFQVQVEFRTDGEEASALEFLEFRASVPAVSRVVGELDPIQVDPGVVTDFTYTLLPRVEPTDAGFDRIEIAALAAEFDTLLGVRIDDVEVPYAVDSFDEKRFVVEVPRVTLAQADAPVEVHFRARALRYGAAFAGHLFDGERPHDVAQPVIPGDAVDEVFSDRLWIETSIAVKSALSVVASPPAITPNGDGVNDETRIAYDLFETTGQVPVAVGIYDLAGRRMRALHRGREGIGHYELIWDGRDDGGRLVAPGIYLFRAAVEVGDRDFEHLGVLHVAY